MGQTATGEFTIHQFKNYVGAASAVRLECELQTNNPPSLSTVYLQIYNRDSTTWENVDSDNTTAINTDFSLKADIADTTNYKNASNVISCRGYQEAT